MTGNSAPSKDAVLGVSKWVLTIFDILMILCFAWILLDIETSPVQPSYEGSDKVSRILVIDAAKAEAVMGAGLMICVLYILWSLKAYLVAGILLTLFSVVNLGVSVHDSCDLSGCLIPSLIMILIPGAVSCALLGRLKDDAATSFSWLVMHLKTNLQWQGLSVFRKVSVGIFDIIILLGAIFLGSLIFELVIGVDEGYNEETRGSKISVDVDLALEALFGILLFSALCFLGPNSFSFSVLNLYFLTKIIYGWTIYMELKSVAAPPEVTTKYLSGVISDTCLLPTVLLGLYFQVIGEKWEQERNGSTRISNNGDLRGESTPLLSA
jgi:hypothetical protein